METEGYGKREKSGEVWSTGVEEVKPDYNDLLVKQCTIMKNYRKIWERQIWPFIKGLCTKHPFKLAVTSLSANCAGHILM
jgi:hypothetical protein